VFDKKRLANNTSNSKSISKQERKSSDDLRNEKSDKNTRRVHYDKSVICKTCKSNIQVNKTSLKLDKESLTDVYIIEEKDKITRFRRKLDDALQSKLKWKNRFMVLKDKIFN
jgi:hypothetical protein